MAGVKWIKLSTGMFDNAKIKYLRKLPEGESIVLIWVMLLTKAGKCNSNGYIFLTENIPYTQEMLAAEFGFEPSVIQLALISLSKLGMIFLEEQSLCIANWEEYQNIEGLDKIREQTRKRVKNHRENKQIADSNGKCNVTVTQGNATEEELDIDIDIDIDIDKSKSSNSSTKVQPIIEAWNSLSLQKLISINVGTNRYKLLQVRIKEFGIDKVLEAIENIKDSSFLRGQNNKSWTVTFDWLIKPNNFIKVLEGNYKDKGGGPNGNGPSGNNTKSNGATEDKYAGYDFG